MKWFLSERENYSNSFKAKQKTSAGKMQKRASRVKQRNKITLQVVQKPKRSAKYQKPKKIVEIFNQLNEGIKAKRNLDYRQIKKRRR